MRKKNWSKKSIDKKYYIINYDVVCFHTRFHIEYEPRLWTINELPLFYSFQFAFNIFFILIYEKILKNNKNINKLLENIEKCAAVVVSWLQSDWEKTSQLFNLNHYKRTFRNDLRKYLIFFIMSRCIETVFCLKIAEHIEIFPFICSIKDLFIGS